MTEIDMDHLQVPTYMVWLDEQTRIASFHCVEGYQQQIFSCHAIFMGFLQSLAERGYRFQ